MTDVHIGVDASDLAQLRRRLMDGLESGEPVVFADTRIPAPRTEDDDAALEQSPSTTAAEVVPASLLREILTDRELNKAADPRGLAIDGAVIDGVLDLDHVTCSYPLAMTNCLFTHYVQAQQAHLHSLALTGTHINGANSFTYAIAADELHVDGSLNLDGLEAAGVVRLKSAHITGRLSMTDAKLTATDIQGRSLVADDLQADSEVFLNGKFEAAGAVRLIAAHIRGELNLSGAKIAGGDDDGESLIANHLCADGNVILTELTTYGAVRLLGAHIAGQLNLREAKLIGTDKDEKCALIADNLRAGSDVYLDDGFEAAGLLRLVGAHITGSLVMSGARITGTDENGHAIGADNLRAEGGVSLDEEFQAAGAIRLIGAHIAGELSLCGAHITDVDTNGYSLLAYGLRAGSDVFLDRLQTAGAVWMSGAEVARSLALRGAKVGGTDEGGNAVLLDELRAGRHVFLEDFVAAGAVRLAGARIAGELSLRGANITGTDSDGDAVVGDSLQTDSAVFIDSRVQLAGTLRLPGANIAQLCVPPRGVPTDPLPRLGSVTGWRLRDVRGVIRNDRRAARDWLDDQERFVAQPWGEFADLYDRNGQPADARRMRYWSAVRATKHGPWWAKPGRWAYRLTTGHGYYPWVAVIWLVVLFAVVFAITATYHDQFTTATTATMRAAAADPLPGRVPAASCTSAWDTPCLNDLSFTIATALPGTAGQAQDWQPPADTFLGIQIASWLQILRTFAWILTALLLAGITGLLRKQT